MSDEMFGDYFKDLSDSLKRAELQRENVLKKMRSDPCFDVPAVGDKVLINAFVAGMGRNGEFLEAEVLKVASTSYKCRFLDYYNFDTKNRDDKVKWIHQDYITDVLK